MYKELNLLVYKYQTCEKIETKVTNNILIIGKMGTNKINNFNMNVLIKKYII